MPVPITAFYASLLAIAQIYFAALVIKERLSASVSLGEGNVDEDPMLQRATRVFGNFTEYVPIALILLLIAELNSVHPYILHGCAVLLLFGRTIHAYGLRHHVGPSWQRTAGMLGTFACMVSLAVVNVWMLYGNV